MPFSSSMLLCYYFLFLKYNGISLWFSKALDWYVENVNHPISSRFALTLAELTIYSSELSFMYSQFSHAWVPLCINNSSRTLSNKNVKKNPQEMAECMPLDMLYCHSTTGKELICLLQWFFVLQFAKSSNHWSLRLLTL